MQQDLREVEVVILDEMSMIAPKLLKNINDRLNMAFPTTNITDHSNQDRQSAHDDDRQSAQIFGGRHVIISGDFCQLPPVRSPQGLYSHSSSSDKQSDGRELFLKFNTVVELSKQLRQKGDNNYSEILNRVRVGNIQSSDLEVLNSRIATETEIKLRLQQAAIAGQSMLSCAATHNKVNNLNRKNLHILASQK